MTDKTILEIGSEGKHLSLGRVVFDNFASALEDGNPDVTSIFVWSDYWRDYVEVTRKLVTWG